MRRDREQKQQHPNYNALKKAGAKADQEMVARSPVDPAANEVGFGMGGITENVFGSHAHTQQMDPRYTHTFPAPAM